MNKDQFKGVARYLAGKVQEGMGNLVGNPGLVLRGLTRQLAGKAQKGRGDLKKTFKDWIHPR